MKDKYEKCFYENEGKGKAAEKLKGYLLRSKYYLQVIKKAGYKNYKVISRGNINFIVTTLSMMSDEWQQLILNRVIKHLNKDTLMLTYVNQCCCFATMKKEKEIDTVMNSFKKSGLIKDIKFNKVQNLFQLQTLDGEYVKFTPEFYDESCIDSFNGKCHAAVEALCHKIDNVYATTAIMQNYFGKDYYHSFVVQDKIVHDFAQNIIMSFENYKKLFGGQVIMSIEGKQLLKNIDRLKERDMEYKENEMCDVLKYAIHKQMKKYS